MKTVLKLAGLIAVSLALATVCAAKTKTVKVGNDEIVLSTSKCKLMLKQSGTIINFGGIDFAPGTPVSKIGSVAVDQKLLQSMSAQAQILDQFQYTACQQINSVPLNDPKRVSLIAVQVVSSYQLAQLAFLVQMYSSNADKLQDAILKWIVSSGDLMQQVWAKQFTAANPAQTEQRSQAANATAYALDKLGAVSDSSKMHDALQDQLKAAIQ